MTHLIYLTIIFLCYLRLEQLGAQAEETAEARAFEMIEELNKRQEQREAVDRTLYRVKPRRKS